MNRIIYDQEIQPARAVLHQNESGYFWLVECPYCGETHFHGGGDLDGDPREFLGHRVSHCTAESGPGYEMIDC